MRHFPVKGARIPAGMRLALALLALVLPGWGQPERTPAPPTATVPALPTVPTTPTAPVPPAVPPGTVVVPPAPPATEPVPGTELLVPPEPPPPPPDPFTMPLPIFGQSLFAQAATEAQPPQAAPVSPAYVLGPGDVLRLRLWTGAVE